MNSWPIGYIKEENQLQLKKLGEQISITTSHFANLKTQVRYIDFAFPVPTNSVPVLLEFKRSTIVEVPKPADSEKAPPAIPFGKNDKDK